MMNQSLIRLSSWILLLTFVVSFSACNPESLNSRTKFLTDGTWSFSDIQGEDLDDDTRAFFILLLGSADFTFDEDGSLEVSLAGTAEDGGDWSLNDDADRLTIASDSTTDTYDIIELTKESLIYSTPDDDFGDLTYSFTKD
jgi:hypothetical protein